MDIDFEELGALLFPNGTPDNEDFEKYLTNLASCGLDKLLREGSHLKEERNLILEETQNFVYKNYKTFINSAECSKTIYNEFNNIETNLESLIQGLPELKVKVDDFLSASKSLSQSRHATLMTLNKHSELLEILEFPQLMETCVRNGYYEDALEILAYVKRLEKKPLDIPLLTSLIHEVKNGTRLMLLQLLMQLRSSLSLPQCLKTVGYLRRLDLFSDSELRVKFLQARDSWFTGLVKAVPKEDAFFHISKVIELYRLHMFDIVTQYRAIFSDDDVKFNLTDSDVNEIYIFNGWIVHKVNQFIGILEKDLKRDIGSNLESVLDQCMFFGLSFSRIGVDFRGHLFPVFQEAMLAKFTADVKSANFKFDESLSSFSLMDVTPLQSTAILKDSQSQDKTNPPLCLMEFSPLVSYTNGLVKAFNTLRQCCLLSLLGNVLELLESSLSKIVTAMLDLYQMESSGFTANEEKSFSRMCLLFTESLVPHLNVGLRLLFPLQAISSVIGRTPVDLQKNNLGQLDVLSICDRIQKFIPPKPSIELEYSTETGEQQTTEEAKSEDIQITDQETKTGEDVPGMDQESRTSEEVHVMDQERLTREDDQVTDQENRTCEDYDNVLINFDHSRKENSVDHIVSNDSEPDDSQTVQFTESILREMNSDDRPHSVSEQCLKVSEVTAESDQKCQKELSQKDLGVQEFSSS